MDSDAPKAAQQKAQFGAEKRSLKSRPRICSQGVKPFRLRSLKCPPRNFACAAPLEEKVENTENQIRQSMAQQIYDAATTIAKQQKLDLISTPPLAL